MDEYEAAAERYDRAIAGIKTTQQAIAFAEALHDLATDEFDAATRNLARFEDAPGVSAKQFRPEVAA